MPWGSEKRNAYKRAYYQLNREREVARVVACNRERRSVARDKIIALKNKPCSDCGGSFHHVAMDFDHVRGVKVLDIAAMRSRSFHWNKIAAEIAKCDLVCSNCHRVRTWRRANAQEAVSA